MYAREELHGQFIVETTWAYSGTHDTTYRIGHDTTYRIAIGNGIPISPRLSSV